MNGLRVGCSWKKHMLKVQEHLREHPILRALLPWCKAQTEFLFIVSCDRYPVLCLLSSTRNKERKKMRQIISKGGMLPLSKMPQLFSQRKKFLLISCLPDTLGIFSWCFMRKWVDLLEGAFRQIAHTVASVRTVRWPFFWDLVDISAFLCMLAGPSLSVEEHNSHSRAETSLDRLHIVWANSQTKNRPFTCPKPSFKSHNFVQTLTCVT